MTEAYSKAVIGFAGLVDVVTALEAELKATKLLTETLREQIRYLENTQEHHKSVLEDLTTAGISDDGFADRVRDVIRDDSVIDDLIDDRIESALSGREVEFNLTGSVTL
jgi:hypothetical protein